MVCPGLRGALPFKKGNQQDARSAEGWRPVPWVHGVPVSWTQATQLKREVQACAPQGQTFSGVLREQIFPPMS